MVAQQRLCLMPLNWTLKSSYNGNYYVYFTTMKKMYEGFLGSFYLPRAGG